MPEGAGWLAAGALVWAGLALVVALVAVVRRALLKPPSPDSADRAPPDVLVLRPCAGAEPWLEHALVSIACAHRPHDLKVRVTAGAEDDPAVPVAERACAELVRLGLDAEVWISPPGAAANHKAGQLAHAIGRGAGDLIVSVDSDVDLTGVDLAALCRAARGGAAWMPPAEREGLPPPGLRHADAEMDASADAVRAQRQASWPAVTSGDTASRAVLGASQHAFSVLCGLDPEGLVGKIFAVDRARLEAAGGFGPLVDYLGEDMELARRIKAAGGHVTPVPGIAPALARGRTLAAVVERYGRWMTVIRAQRPALLVTYPLFFFPTLPVLPLALIGAGQAPGLALTAISLVATSRVLLTCAARVFAQRPLEPWMWPLDVLRAEGVLSLAFIRALSTRRLMWRGRALKIDRQGRLVRADEG